MYFDFFSLCGNPPVILAGRYSHIDNDSLACLCTRCRCYCRFSCPSFTASPLQLTDTLFIDRYFHPLQPAQVHGRFLLDSISAAHRNCSVSFAFSLHIQSLLSMPVLNISIGSISISLLFSFKSFKATFALHASLFPTFYLSSFDRCPPCRVLLSPSTQPASP